MSSLVDVTQQIADEERDPPPILTLSDGTTIQLTSSSQRIDAFLNATNLNHYTQITDQNHSKRILWWYIVLPVSAVVIMAILILIFVYTCRRTNQIKNQQL